MKRVGEVVRTAQGLAIARVPAGDDDGDDGSDYSRIGTMVVDENLDDVGRVVDVFGPVARPYVAVSPADGVVEARLLGAKLYAR